MRHNALQKKYKNEHMDSWRADVPPTSPSDGGTPPNPSIEGERPTLETDIPENSNAQGTNNEVCGGCN